MSPTIARVLLVFVAMAFSVVGGAAVLGAGGLLPGSDLWVPGLWIRFTPAEVGVLARALWAVGGLLVCLLSLWVALAAARGNARGPAEFVVDEDILYGGGRVYLSSRAIEAAVTRACLDTSGVVHAQPRLQMSRAGWQVSVAIETDPNGGLPDISRVVQENIRTSLQHLTGIAVNKLEVWLSPARLAPRPVR